MVTGGGSATWTCQIGECHEHLKETAAWWWTAGFGYFSGSGGHPQQLNHTLLQIKTLTAEYSVMCVYLFHIISR